QLEDCAGMAPLFLALAQQTRVPVRGLIVGGPATVETALLARKYGLDFPVRRIAPRPAGLLARHLGYTTTPFLMAIDGGGRVVGAAAARTVKDVMQLVTLSEAASL